MFTKCWYWDKQQIYFGDVADSGGTLSWSFKYQGQGALTHKQWAMLCKIVILYYDCP